MRDPFLSHELAVGRDHRGERVVLVRVERDIFHRVAKMTAVDVLGRVDELADGMGGSVDAVTETAIAPFRGSRLRKSKER